MIAQFLGGNLWRTVALALLGVCASMALWIFGVPILGGGLLVKLDRITALNASNVESHRATKRNFRTAMAEAKRFEQARLDRVKAEQERINDREKQDYDRRIAALRARYDSLRSQARAGVAGAAGSEQVPALSYPAFGPDAAPGTGGLSLAERYQCSATSIQLDSLISWIEGQTKVKVND